MKSWRYKLHGSEFTITRLHEGPPPCAHPDTLDCADTAAAYLRQQLATALTYRPDVENLMVVHLTTKLKPIGFEVVSTGTIDTLLIDPRAIFRSAIVTNSAAIILAHNHPSGDPTPSDADIKVTRDLIRAGQLLKISVHDHLILGHNTHKSLREQGYFYL